MHEIRLKLIKKVSFSRISCIFRDFPRDGESDACEDCRCKMPQKNGEHHHVYRQKDDVAYSFHIALILYIVIRLQIYKKICKPDNGKTENYTFPTLFPWFLYLSLKWIQKLDGLITVSLLYSFSPHHEGCNWSSTWETFHLCQQSMT